MTKPKDAKAASAKDKAATAKNTAEKTTPSKEAPKTPVSEASAPKAAPAPESAKTETAAPEAPAPEAPKADEAPKATSGGLGDLFNLITGAQKVDPSSVFGKVTEHLLGGADKDKEESSEEGTEGFAQELIADAMRMAQHPVWGRRGGNREEPPAPDFSIAGLFGRGPGADERCCREEEDALVFAFPVDVPEEKPTPSPIVIRDETTASFGHLVELKKLHDVGILTDEEYTSKKQDILRSIYR